MKRLGIILFTFLAEVGGGPGPSENNLVRFGLAAVLWSLLLVAAWKRHRSDQRPRERLLVWGFALGLIRELFMFFRVSMRILDVAWPVVPLVNEPLEHSLSMAAIVMVAGAFLRYLSDDAHVSRRYLQVGLGATFLSFVAALWQWGQLTPADPGITFNLTWGGAVIHIATAGLILAAVVLLGRQRGWVRNVVILALTLLLADEGIFLYNFVTTKACSSFLCPIGNALHILAIPLLGYVYSREQAIEKQVAEEALADYREHLEELVEERTSELSAQNAIAATISRSLDLDEILKTSLDTALRVLDMDVGCIFLAEPEAEHLNLQTVRGVPHLAQREDEDEAWLCLEISARAVREVEPLVTDVPARACGDLPRCDIDPGPHTLVSTPLICQDHALGALTLATCKSGPIRPERLELLKAIGQQIGVAVGNARLYQEQERWAKELTLLHQASLFLSATLDPDTIYQRVNEQAPRLVGCQVAHIFRWDADGEEAVGVSSSGVEGAGLRGVRLAAEESILLRQLTARRRPIPIEDGRTDPRVPAAWREVFDVGALLSAPIWGRKEPLGLLFLIDQHGPRRWRADELDLIESFVNRASVALENAYLHQHMEWAAALEERQRIAADMHDGLAQTLSHMGHRVDRMAELSDAGQLDALSDECRHVRDVIDRATRDVRRSIASLQKPPLPRRPLQDWLAETVRRFAAQDETPTQLVTSVGAPLFLRSAHVDQVLQIVQEALTNAVRHAYAQRIFVSLERQGRRAVVTVEDDGRGFDPQAMDGDGHFGISIMDARAARIGGGLDIDTGPGLGTRVTLTWPIEETTDAP